MLPEEREILRTETFFTHWLMIIINIATDFRFDSKSLQHSRDWISP